MSFDLIISFIFLLVFIICLGFAIYSKVKLEGFRQIVIQLISEAEKTIEQGKNHEKFTKVLNEVREFLPPVLKMFITEENLIYFIQKTFDSIKVALDTKTLYPVEDIKTEIEKIEEELQESEG